MSASPPAVRPRRFEERNVPPALQGLVSRVLRSGVVLGGLLLAVGIVWEAAVGHGSLLTSLAPTTGPGLARFIGNGGPSALVLLGVLVLVVTPIGRVGLSAALFAAGRDRPFALITLFVLAILGATILVGALH